MRYQYSCATCKLTDVKRFDYNKENKPVCMDCGEVLERHFIKPPQQWTGQQRER